MERKFLKLVGLMLSAVLVLSAMGCSDSSNSKETKNGKFAGYPMNSEETLTWWCSIDTNLTATTNSLNDSEYGKALQKQIGINIKFDHPSVAGGGDQFNLMLASGKLPDVIEHYWVDFPGGGEKAISDGYIIPLNDAIDKWAPNFKKFIEEHPEYDKYIKTDSGVIYAFPYISAIRTPNGLIIRKDWLDDLNLEVPETLEDWHNVLTQFKEKKGASAPLSGVPFMFKMGAFSGAFGFKPDLYVDNDKIKFGCAQPEYKEFLTMMNQWYNEGLIDKNLFTIDGKIIDSNILNGVSGATAGGITGGIGKYTSAMKDKDKNYNVVAAPYPVMEKGSICEFGPYVNPVDIYRTAISTSCKNVEMAVRAIDYLYSEEGIRLVNYGVEGKSYTMENGKPKFTDEVLHNAEGLTVGQSLSRFARPYNTSYSVQLREAYTDTLFSENMVNALDIWAKHNGGAHVMPPLYPTEEEQKKLAKLTNAIDTYCSEMLAKFITGVTPLSEFDSYLEKLDQLGVDEMISLKQSEYDRFLKR